VAGILRKMVITKRVYVTGYYINSRPSVEAWMGGIYPFSANA